MREVDEAELYFIDLCYIKNKDLLRLEFKRLYQVLLENYIKHYKAGKEARVDLNAINDRFINCLGVKVK